MAAANPTEHMRLLRDSSTVSGEPSLQNALELARTSLKYGPSPTHPHPMPARRPPNANPVPARRRAPAARLPCSHVPKHSSREVIVVLGSLTTCDPGNILRTIEVLREDKIRCSVISLSAELHVCRTLCSMTGGTHAVVLHDDHFREVLMAHVMPPAVTASATESNLVGMGFPRRRQTAVATLCAWYACGPPGHGERGCARLNQRDRARARMHSHKQWTTAGFTCPRCGSKVCDLPTECPVCSLTLISSPHLARTYHHLFPLDVFTECTPFDTYGRIGPTGVDRSQCS